MIPERDTVTVDSTVKGEDVAMSIDQSALAHIMNVLTDLYSDPEMAVIREYATNALDSHIEAGQSRPIEVITPTALRPIFTVRDFGVGLDADDIRDIYSRYGASTKRSTNDAVGMLGLGCKSALAYVDQFTLIGIKDGERIAVSISRDETGAGVMTVLESGGTKEPDGAEVSVPVRGGDLLEIKAEEFFAFWEPGTVLLNGAPPEPVSGWQINERFAIRDKPYNYGPGLIAVMGNVPYPAPDDFEAQSDIMDGMPQAKQIIARVPIGAVQFAPSREALQDHPTTRAALEGVLAEFREDCQGAIRDQIEGADTRPEAAKALVRARAAIGAKNVGEVQWNGEDIPVSISAEDSTGDIWRAVPPNKLYRGTTAKVPAGQIPLDNAAACPWIVGFNNNTWSATMRRKFIHYLQHHNILEVENWGDLSIYITNAPRVPRPDWIDGAVLAVEWQKVREWRDPDREQGGAGGGESYAGTYPTWQAGRWRKKFPADELPRYGRDLYYVEGETRLVRNEKLSELLSPDAFLVELTGPRAAKFKRLFPHARPAEECAKAALAGRWAALSGEEQAAYLIGSDIDDAIMTLAGEELADPSLAILIDIGTVSAESEPLAKFRTLAVYNYFFTAPTLGELGLEDWEAIQERYPLLGEVYAHRLDSKMRKHLVLYVNAAYAALATKEDS